MKVHHKACLLRPSWLHLDKNFRNEIDHLIPPRCKFGGTYREGAAIPPEDRNFFSRRLASCQVCLLNKRARRRMACRNAQTWCDAVLLGPQPELLRKALGVPSRLSALLPPSSPVYSTQGGRGYWRPCLVWRREIRQRPPGTNQDCNGMALETPQRQSDPLPPRALLGLVRP